MAENLPKGAGSSDAVIQTLKWVRKQGFKPVALRKQSKAALGQQYVDLNYNPPDDSEWLRRDIGIGVVTGPSHSGPIDIDLDCPEAIFFAERFLPSTPAIFGRKSKLRSHYLYRVDDAVSKLAFIDPIARSTICEIRADGGHQTVFPGSLHEATGEEIQWADNPFPDVVRVNFADLNLSVRKVAIATLIARHMWAEGQRNEICKHLAGVFYYQEWTLDETKALIQAIMDYSGDEDKTRIRTVVSTYKKGEQGGKITGSNSLREFLGDDKIVNRMLEWAGNEVATMLQEFNEKYAVVAIEGKFRIAATTPLEPSGQPVFYTKDDFLNFTAVDCITGGDGKPIPKSKIWLKSPKRRTYNTVDFVPGVEDPEGVLNLWTGWAVKPDPKASCVAWLDLLYYVICGSDDNLYNWMINWFANMVREPLNKPLTSPVIVGRQGAGKSLLFGYFGKILGQGYIPVSNPDHIYGKFNRHLASTILLHSEEALFAGDKRQAEIIKDLITGTTRVFEQKGIDAKNVKNHLRLAFTSNDNWAVRAEDGDRRYTIIDMDKRKVDPDRMKAVLDEMENNGPAGLLHYLQTMEYDPVIIRTNIKNEALLTLKQINFDPVASWWHETLKQGQVLPDYLHWATKPERMEWPQVVSSVALFISMASKMKDLGQRYIPNETSFSLKLNKMIGTKLERKQTYFSNPMSDQAPLEVRKLPAKQYAIFNMPSLVECRRAFEEYVGQPIEWPQEEVVDERPLHEKY